MNVGSGLIEEGVQLSTSTTSKINYILKVVNHVQSEVREVIGTIKEQKDFSKEVMSEIGSAKSIFDNQHPHTRDFSRELGCFLVLRIKEFFQKK